MPKMVKARHTGNGGPVFFSRGGRMVKVEKGSGDETMPEEIYNRHSAKLQLVEDVPMVTADVKRHETPKRGSDKWTLAMSPADYLDRFGSTVDPSPTVADRLALARRLTGEK